ncbi:hypothetical protein N657DRAFT_544697, partial [Parathielavia appendiculata]
PHPIWVDTLCIDQDNIPKRNTQVRMMPAIHHKAEVTFSWLGSAEDDDYIAI